MPRSGVSAVGDVFDALIDFGYGAFSAGARWVEVAVSPAGANAFEELSPPSPITPAPLAPGLPNTFADHSTGFVSIGTRSRITAPTLFQVTSPVTSGWGGMYGGTSGETGRPFYGYSLSGSANAWHEFNGESGEWRLYTGGVPRMRVSGQEARFGGDVTQEVQNGGLVKLALLAHCRKVDPYVLRVFDSIDRGLMYMADGSDSGGCTIDFGIDISERFWSVDAVASTGSYDVTCGPGQVASQLDCFRTNLADFETRRWGWRSVWRWDGSRPESGWRLARDRVAVAWPFPAAPVCSRIVPVADQAGSSSVLSREY